MKFILVLLLTAACGTERVKNDEGALDSEGVESENTNSDQLYSFAVRSVTDLPACEKSQLTRLAYAKSEKAFYECSETGWELIEVSISAAKDGSQGVAGKDAKPATDHIFDGSGNDIGTIVSSEISANGTIKVLLVDGVLADLQLSSGKIRFIYGDKITIYSASEVKRVVVSNLIFSAEPFNLYKSQTAAVGEEFSFGSFAEFQGGIRTASGSQGMYYPLATTYAVSEWKPAFAAYPFALPMKIKKVED